MSEYDSSASFFLSAYSDMSSSFDLSYCCDSDTRNDDWLWGESSEVSAERQQLWDSLTGVEKITGTLLSLLTGGGTAFLIGYIFT